MKICAACCQELPKDKFSKKQWQLKQYERRCKECIASNLEVQLRPPTNGGTQSHVPSPHEMVVDGCGVEEINGIYRKQGVCDGVPVYVKEAPDLLSDKVSAGYLKYSQTWYKQRDNIEFSLYRCRLTDNTRGWYISIVPENERPGTTKDIDFYATAPAYDNVNSPLPPRESWMSIRSLGVDPAPIVFPLNENQRGATANIVNDSSKISITVQRQHGHGITFNDVDPKTVTFHTIKLNLERKWGYLSSRQHLVFQGITPEDNATLCNLLDGSVLQLKLDRMQITVQESIDGNGRITKLDVYSTNTINDVKMMIQEMWNIQASDQHLVLVSSGGGRIDIEDEKTLSENNATDNSIFHLSQRTSAASSTEPSCGDVGSCTASGSRNTRMLTGATTNTTSPYVSVKMIYRGNAGNVHSRKLPFKSFHYLDDVGGGPSYRVVATDTVRSVKTKIQEKWQIPLSLQRLMYGNLILDETEDSMEDTLSDYDVKNGDTIHVITKTTEDDISIDHCQFEEILFSANGDPFEHIRPPILSFTEQKLLIIHEKVKNWEVDFKDVGFIKQSIDPAGFGDEFGCTGELVIMSSGSKFSVRLKCLCDSGGHEVDSFITALKTAFRKVAKKMKPDNAWRDDSKQWKIDASSQHTYKKGSAQDTVKKETASDSIQINVRNISGESISFDIKATSTVHAVKLRIKDAWQINPPAQRMIFCGKELVDDKNLLGYNIVNGSTLQLLRRIVPPVKKITVIFESGSSIDLDVKPTDTIRSIKVNIQDIIQVHPTYQRLIFSGVQLDDEKLLSYYNTEEYNLKDLSHLHLSISIVRAQKVIADLIWRVISLQRRSRWRRSAIVIQRNIRRMLVMRQVKAREAICDFIWHHHQQRKSRKVIATFVWRTIVLQRRRRSRSSAITIQKHLRGVSIRRIYSSTLQPRLEDIRHFYAVWKKPLGLVPHNVQSLSGWALVRDRTDLKRVDLLDEDGNLAETDEKLEDALLRALSDDNKTNKTWGVEQVEEEFSDLAVGNDHSHSEQINSEPIDWSQFQVTSHVVKFMKNGDTKYREIFVKRMKQLAKGERSHKLQKPLQGCESVIYESYLENKGGGFRILWTEEGDRIVVWFIAKHKSVSRLAKLIDDAKNRTARQQMPQTLVDELNNADPATQPSAKREILLDPVGNVPMKLYDVNLDSIDDIATTSWTPQMSLTDEERKVVEAKGTVLLLGRSGTGKTICICNRIEYDRQRLGEKSEFSQLFVSRSNRLCVYVENAVGSNRQSEFHTFDNLLHELDVSLSEEERSTGFNQRQRVGFAQFKQFYDERYPQEKIAALIVWKAIRTFTKGSIEAFQSSAGVLSREYFVSDKLGKNRCKVPIDLRGRIYEIFVQYQSWLKELNLWDDCDRIHCLLQQIEEAKRTDSVVYEKVKWGKIYVDEVQDYTQIEILLFFYISSGPGSLFLAGDPAQSVVEGTGFRFEEIRSVGYFVAGDRRHLIPEKPKVVNINFRSHSGILNCAGRFLDLLFDYFPGSAKQLKKDYGLFRGARPGVFNKVEVQQLSTLLHGSLQGCVILTHDESASRWRDALDHPLVYGIREAKGLEFKSVIILDFFSEISSSLQKPWRNLLLNRAGDDFESEYPLIETHLKLIYTATTRCIEQLFFAETGSSIAGDAAMRWLTTTKASSAAYEEAIATHNNVSDLDSMIMTNDEFCIAGIDNAELAASPDIELEQASSYLKRAIYCFDKAQSSELVAKANAHLESVQLRAKYAQAKSFTHNELEAVERETAQLTQLLLKEDLLLECTKLLNFITPFLSRYTQEQLEERILIKVQQ